MRWSSQSAAAVSAKSFLVFVQKYTTSFQRQKQEPIIWTTPSFCVSIAMPMLVITICVTLGAKSTLQESYAGIVTLGGNTVKRPAKNLARST
jgi:hypothetical protein